MINELLIQDYLGGYMKTAKEYVDLYKNLERQGNNPHYSEVFSAIRELPYEEGEKLMEAWGEMIDGDNGYGSWINTFYSDPDLCEDSFK